LEMCLQLSSHVLHINFWNVQLVTSKVKFHCYWRYGPKSELWMVPPPCHN